MATAGSGDVLTGILLGLLARGYQPADAAMMGMYLHGLAGDLAAKALANDPYNARNEEVFRLTSNRCEGCMGRFYSVPTGLSCFQLSREASF